MEVNFIAKSKLSARPDYFPRVKSKDLLNGNKIHSVKFLHFESHVDMNFIRSFVNNIPSRTNKTPPASEIEYVFTPTKLEAIKEHRDALKMGLNVSSLVDMDSDINCNMIRKTKRIHTSRYACTIITIQFLKDEMILDFDYLFKTINKISGLSNEKRIKRIISNAINNTIERLCKGNTNTKTLFSEQNLQNPLNDHELAAAIVTEMKKPEYFSKKIEKELRKYAANDTNGLLGIIVDKMISELNT